VKVVFSARGRDDHLWWQRQDRKLLKRINQLTQDVMRIGNEGIGKPEPLKHGFQGYWSRRVNDEHRLVYKVVDHEVRIAACRYHDEPWPRWAARAAAKGGGPIRLTVRCCCSCRQ
jgi:toxin YoeB